MMGAVIPPYCPNSSIMKEWNKERPLQGSHLCSECKINSKANFPSTDLDHCLQRKLVHNIIKNLKVVLPSSKNTLKKQEARKFYVFC